MSKEEEYLISLEYDGNEVIETNQDAKNGRADYVSKLMESYHQSRVNAISDEFKKILEAESDCKGIYLTKGTIRGSDALDAFEIWINKLLKQ